MQDKELFCNNTLIQYMKDYLENKINKDDYYELSEICYLIIVIV